MVAWADFAPFFRDSCDDRVLVMAPSVTVKDSAVSDSASSVAAMVMVWVAPTALLAAKGHRARGGRATQVGGLCCVRYSANGSLQATVTSLATDLDRVTVKLALLPSATLLGCWPGRLC